MEIKQFLDEIKSKKKHTKNRIVVGYLDSKVISFLQERKIPIFSKEIYLTHKGLSHLSRHSKQKRGAGLSDSDILKIPEIIQKPSAVYFDTKKEKLNLLYCAQTDNCFKFVKLVVDVNSYTNRKEKVTLIKTAGYIEAHNIEKNQEYVIVM
ncbi:hypothetical protein MNB_SM-7-660 [hydrothermal vent metagenome]|uniref:Phage-Barnase-EndoU-ColicinE5/D-RelE like nuclease 3 domain-containing protein n=1 Tax=hydrothermal vent metagenome TaxID=652676 RepID=A0A1W1BMS2_9ZZZZ